MASRLGLAGVDQLRCFVLSPPFQTAVQFTIAVLVVGLFVFIRPLTFPLSCLSAVMLAVALAVLSPDNHIGTRLQASATELGGLVGGILLGGVVLTLSRLAAPSTCGGELVGCSTHTAVLCLLGVAALGLLVANRAVVGAPYPSHLWLGGLLGTLGYGIVLIAGQFTADLAVLWKDVIGQLLLMSLLGTGTCALVSVLVLPSLAMDEMRADTAAAIRGIGHAASSIASRALCPHDPWRPAPAPAAVPASEAQVPAQAPAGAAPLPQPPEPRASPLVHRRVSSSATDHRHPPSDLPPISEVQLTAQDSAAQQLPELASPPPPPPPYAAHPRAGGQVTHGSGEGREDADDDDYGDGEGPAGRRPRQVGFSPQSPSSLALPPGAAGTPGLSLPAGTSAGEPWQHGGPRPSHPPHVYHQHRLYRLGTTSMSGGAPFGPRSATVSGVGPATGTEVAAAYGWGAAPRPPVAPAPHVEGLPPPPAQPPGWLRQPARPSSRRLPGVASCPALDKLDGRTAAADGNDSSYGDEYCVSRHDSSFGGGYASSSASSDDERVQWPWGWGWGRMMWQPQQQEAELGLEFEEVMEDEDAFLRLLREATAPTDPRVGGADARQPPPPVAPPGGIRPSPSAFELMHMPTTGVSSSGAPASPRHGDKNKEEKNKSKGKGKDRNQAREQQLQEGETSGRAGGEEREVGREERGPHRGRWRDRQWGRGRQRQLQAVEAETAVGGAKHEQDEVVAAAAAAAVAAALPGPGAGPTAAASGGGLMGGVAAVAWAPVSALRPLLARAGACAAAAALEPPWMCAGPCDLAAWSRVLRGCEVLVDRVAALECLTQGGPLLGGDGAEANLVAMLGANIAVPYRRVYGEVAASCAAMSIAVAECLQGATREGRKGRKRDGGAPMAGDKQTHGSVASLPFPAVGGWEESKQRLRGVVRDALSTYWARVRGAGSSTPSLDGGAGGGNGGNGGPLLSASVHHHHNHYHYNHYNLQHHHQHPAAAGR